jgi:hypothetical protein
LHSTDALDSSIKYQIRGIASIFRIWIQHLCESWIDCWSPWRWSYRNIKKSGRKGRTVDRHRNRPTLIRQANLRVTPVIQVSFKEMSSPRETMVNGTHHNVDTHRYGSFSFASEEEDPFFVTHAKPDGLDIVKAAADSFIRYQKTLNRPVVLVTSGGSTVPLEVCFSWFGGSCWCRTKRCDLSIISVRGQGALVLVLPLRRGIVHSRVFYWKGVCGDISASEVQSFAVFETLQSHD